MSRLGQSWRVTATTADRDGNRHTWSLTGRPAFCDDATMRRRLERRHYAKFGVGRDVLARWSWAEPIGAAA